MGTIGKVQINLEAQYAQFSKGVQQAGKDLNSLTRNVEHLKKAEAGADIFDKLREGLGKKSALGETMHLLEGKGPVAGLTGAAELIKHMAEGAAKLKEEFQSGKKGAGEITEELIKGIPVVGQFWSAGRAIRELFTNEGTDLESANAQAKTLDTVIKSQRESMSRLADEARNYAEYWAKAAEAIQLANMPDSTIGERRAKDVKGSENNEADDIRRLEAERAKAISDAAKANQPAIDAARKDQNDYAHADHGDTSPELVQALLQARGNAVLMAAQTQRDAEAHINADYDGRELIARQKAATDRAAIVAKSQTEQQKAIQEAAERDGKAIGDAQATADEANMRAKGQSYQADLAALRRALHSHAA